MALLILFGLGGALACVFAGRKSKASPPGANSMRGHYRYTGNSTHIKFEEIEGTSYEAIDTRTGQLIHTSAKPPEHPISRYFDSFASLGDKQRRGDYEGALKIAWDAALLFPEVIRDSGLDILLRSPPLDYVCEHLAVTRDRAKLEEFRRVMRANLDLPWLNGNIDSYFEDLEIMEKAWSFLAQHPGHLQQKLGKETGLDARRLSILLRRAEARKLIRREPSGKTHKIYLSS